MFKKRHPPVGARPGTLVIRDDAPTPKIRLLHYSGEDQIRETEVTDLDMLREAFGSESSTWVDVQGFGDESAIQKIGEIFSLHPLVIEDIVNVPQRPNAEWFDEQLLLIVRMVRPDGRLGHVIEQVSIVLGQNYVLTFQEEYGDVLEPVRERIRRGGGPIRRHGAGYLAYAIYDTIIDAYYPVLEAIGDRLEELEQPVVDDPTPRLLGAMNTIRNQLANLRRSIGPHREAVGMVIRDANPLLEDAVRVYFRDTYDHCVQATEVVELYREMVTNLTSTYLSSVANRTNDVMKILTIMASIFIPLTFVAGIYGMNFEHMPELHSRWAYPMVWATMLAVAGGMLLYFRNKGWIGQGRDKPRDR